MATGELQDVQTAARWIADTNAKDSAETCRILGISRARLSQLMAEGELLGRKFGGRVWIPQAEIDRHIIPEGEIRVGRPRSGMPQKPAKS